MITEMIQDAKEILGKWWLIGLVLIVIGMILVMGVLGWAVIEFIAWMRG